MYINDLETIKLKKVNSNCIDSDTCFCSNGIPKSSVLPLVVGKGVSGDLEVIDLVSVQNLLVTGVTGSGKSNLLHLILNSLINFVSPDKMNLVLIDPKRLELGPYSILPHSISPLISSVDLALRTLKWAKLEIEKREELISLGRTNVGVGIDLPRIVIVVDEFADLLLDEKGGEIIRLFCEMINREDCMGIHLILTTQRACDDVITPILNSKIDTRICFKVGSANESQIVLNEIGAERLADKGELLFKNRGELKRLQSYLVNMNDVLSSIKKWEGKPAEYSKELMSFLKI